MSWWQIDLHCADADEAAGVIEFERLTGFEVMSPSLQRCFIEGDESAVDQFRSYALSLGLDVGDRAQVPDENWVQRCRDVWTPIQVEALELLPVTDIESGRAVAPGPGRLLLIPGMGFGSGHHTSTQIALRLVQDPAVRALPARRALDVGTGNGVLAIAASRHLGSSVIATDNDPLALENALDNVRLNHCDATVTLLEGTFPSDAEPFDLVTANIYAEVLCQLEPDLARAVRASGLLVLSGIMAEKAVMIEEGFARRWVEVRRIEEPGWTAFLYRRHA